MMGNRGFHLFRIFGFNVTADWSWLVIFALMSLSLATGFFPSLLLGGTSGGYWMMGIVAAALLFFSVVLHEVGHSYVALRNGIRILGIRLFIFGGIAQLEREPDSPDTELKVAMAGPVVSATLAALFYLTSRVYVPLFGPEITVISYFLARANLAMALFNLIPGFPLDGGRILRGIVWKLRSSYFHATRVATQAGKIVAFGFIGFGVLSLLTGGMVGGLWLAFIGVFLYQAAQTVYQQAALQHSPLGWFFGARPLEGFRMQAPELEETFFDDDWVFPQNRREPGRRRIRIYM